MKNRYKHKDKELADVTFESEKPIEEWGYGTEVVVKKDDYPHWICCECAESRGYPNRCLLSTWHEDQCGWCEQIKAVTQPRDFGYPKFSKN